MNNSNILGSVNAGRSSKLNHSVDKKAESQVKKTKLGSSTTKIERKPKTQNNKMDSSINYGRATFTKSI